MEKLPWMFWLESEVFLGSWLFICLLLPNKVLMDLSQYLLEISSLIIAKNMKIIRCRKSSHYENVTLFPSITQCFTKRHFSTQMYACNYIITAWIFMCVLIVVIMWAAFLNRADKIKLIWFKYFCNVIKLQKKVI